MAGLNPLISKKITFRYAIVFFVNTMGRFQRWSSQWSLWILRIRRIHRIKFTEFRSLGRISMGVRSVNSVNSVNSGHCARLHWGIGHEFCEFCEFWSLGQISMEIRKKRTFKATKLPRRSPHIHQENKIKKFSGFCEVRIHFTEFTEFTDRNPHWNLA